MLDLSAPKALFDIALPYGLSVTVKPLTTAGMAAAQAAARRAVEAIERQVRERTEAGLALDGLPDFSAEGERDGFCQTQLIRGRAVRHVTIWIGVELEGRPVMPTPENIAAVMELYPMGSLEGEEPAGFPERTMSRLPDLSYDGMTAEQQRVHDQIKAGPRGKVVGPLKVWLYSAELADRAQKLGAYVRYNSTLPAELSELAILVTARLWTADFEWHSHVDPARVAGIPDAVIEAIRLGAEPALEDARSRAVYAVARELHEARALSDRTYAQAEAALGRQRLVDLVGLLGYYALISMTLKAFDVSTPDGARPFED